MGILDDNDQYYIYDWRKSSISGDRAGQYSIRVNMQWRVCFTWDEGAHEVEIVDYH